MSGKTPKPMRVIFSRWLALLLLVLAIGFFILPLSYLLATAFKTPGDIPQGYFFATKPTLANFAVVLTGTPLIKFIINSVRTACLAGLITTLVAVPATYAIVKLHAGRRIMPNMILGSYLAPPVVALIPLFFLMQGAHLMDSVTGLALMHGLMNVPVAFWLLRNFVRDIPSEIEEAAWVDGAGYWRTLIRVVLPLLLPGVVATGLIVIILSYNEFLFASAMTFSPRSRTLTVAISLFQGDRLVNYGQMAAAAAIGTLPIYTIAVLFQRWLIGGLTHGSIR